MLYGDPCWVDDLLDALAARLAKLPGLTADRVFESLASDDDHLRHPPADTFCVVRPANFPVSTPGVVGGGRLLTGFDGVFRIALFHRYAADQEFRDGKLMRERSRSVTRLQLHLLSLLQMWSPVGATAGKSLLREPMRVRQFDLLPRRMQSGAASWAVCPSTWEAKFTAKLPETLPA